MIVSFVTRLILIEFNVIHSDHQMIKRKFKTRIKSLSFSFLLEIHWDCVANAQSLILDHGVVKHLILFFNFLICF